MDQSTEIYLGSKWNLNNNKTTPQFFSGLKQALLVNDCTSPYSLAFEDRHHLQNQPYELDCSGTYCTPLNL